MRASPILYVLGVALLATSASVTANQSDPYVGVHEIPSFICDRVELVPDMAVDCRRGELGAGGSGWGGPDDAPVRGSRSAICGRRQ